MKRKDGFIMKKSKIALIECALSLVAVIISAVCAFTIILTGRSSENPAAEAADQLYL